MIRKISIVVKVLLTSTDEEGRPIEPDSDKVKVTVTVTENDQTNHSNRFPVVLLKRLSKCTIEKYTNPKSAVTENRPQHRYATRGKQQFSSKESTKNEPKPELKRKSELESAKLNIPKKQKVAKENVLPQTIELVENVNEICKPVTKISTENNIIAVLDYSLHEIVWGKIRGWPHWPAKITSIEGRRYEVIWFNDYRKSKLFRSQLFKFFKNYDEFSKLFDQKVGLETAAKEAVILLAHNANNK